jgi:hypothetical protein
MLQILEIRPDAAPHTKDALNEERRFHPAPLHEIGKIVEVADIIAFELESCAVPVP